MKKNYEEIIQQQRKQIDSVYEKISAANKKVNELRQEREPYTRKEDERVIFLRKVHNAIIQQDDNKLFQLNKEVEALKIEFEPIIKEEEKTMELIEKLKKEKKKLLENLEKTKEEYEIQKIYDLTYQELEIQEEESLKKIEKLKNDIDLDIMCGPAGDYTIRCEWQSEIDKEEIRLSHYRKQIL